MPIYTKLMVARIDTFHSVRDDNHLRTCNLDAIGKETGYADVVVFVHFGVPVTRWTEQVFVVSGKAIIRLK